MIESSQIRIQDGSSVVKFQWSDFDGDDCFKVHRIEIDDEVIELGECHVSANKKLIDLVDGKIKEVEGGFRNPDIILYCAEMIGTTFRIEITRLGTTQIKELVNPVVSADRGFMAEHWGLA